MSHTTGIGTDLLQTTNGLEETESNNGQDSHVGQLPLKCKPPMSHPRAACRERKLKHANGNCELLTTEDNGVTGEAFDHADAISAGEEYVVKEKHHQSELSVEAPPMEHMSCPSPTGPCPPHVMAEVHVRNPPERERLSRGMQDSKSLDEISHTYTRSRVGQSEGRRATISSALELEGTVSHDGDLTNFITRNLEHKIKMSSRPSLDSCSSVRSRGSLRRPADIPPIDPGVLVDLQRHTQDVAHSVELMVRSLNGTIQNMTALSVGYIQTYRDSVDSLGEAVDMSIKGMYTLMARCEELDRSMQPIHGLAKQIRDIKRTLEAMETLYK